MIQTISQPNIQAVIFDIGGVIVRTVAEGVTEDHFRREIDSLLATWNKIQRKQQYVKAPALLHREAALTRSLIRDGFSAKVDALWVDSKELHGEIIQYLQLIDPELEARVRALVRRSMGANTALIRLGAVSYTHLTLPTIYSV